MAKSLVISDFSLVFLMIALSRFVANYGLIIPFQTVNPFLFQQVGEPRQRQARTRDVLWRFDRIGKVQNIDNFKTFLSLDNSISARMRKILDTRGLSIAMILQTPTHSSGKRKYKGWF